MKFRLARHTDNLTPIINFYTEILGLEVFGNFKDHDGYNGVFLGIPGADWHLEFTTSAEPAQHQPDEDDLLVFYPASAEEYIAIIERFTKYNIPPNEPKNPYWKINGTLYKDPDGFGVMIVKP
ncbi:MAG: prolyl endopeptidase [Flavobacterium psychrophilum]|nr:MAG: prolyl endopeptidase [Flavobacterium psychrophilum]